MERIFLQQSTEVLNLKEGQLILREGTKVLDVFPIATVEQVCVYGNAQITTQALKECLKEGIRVLYFTINGRFLGRMEPDYPRDTVRRLNQYRVYWDRPRRLAWAKELLRAKVRGEQVELRRLRERGIDFPADKLREKLKTSEGMIERARTLPELLGVEGTFTRHYFSVFGRLLPPGFRWEGRSTFPAADVENSLLSLIYGCCAMEFRKLCEYHGLDPHCSFLHEPGRNRGGLVYDLLEICRAPLCDHYAFFCFRKYAKALLKNGRAPSIPAELREKICSGFTEKLSLRKSRQKFSGQELLREIIGNTLRCIDLETAVPEYTVLLPAR